MREYSREYVTLLRVVTDISSSAIKTLASWLSRLDAGAWIPTQEYARTNQRQSRADARIPNNARVLNLGSNVCVTLSR